jgi:hypothetical protein
MTILLVLALSVPCVSVSGGPADGAALNAAGITRVCTDADLASREAVPAPGTEPRPGLASPTRAPWIVANGWRFLRNPGGKYIYDAPAGKGALAAAEAFTYGADAALKIVRADIPLVGAMLKFLAGLDSDDLPAVADLGVVDDGSAVTGEVMNLLARRNLLFQIVPASSSRFAVNIRLGTPEYPTAEAADPSAFALKIRRQLGDERRALRLYGSEVVIARLTADERRARVHLLNYGGREIEGLRVRLRGSYAGGEARVAGGGVMPLQDLAASGGFTEFSIPRILAYAVVDLKQ